jgi:hypothetical protein
VGFVVTRVVGPSHLKGFLPIAEKNNKKKASQKPLKIKCEE